MMISEVFQKIASQYPQVLAVKDNKRSLTYMELDELSNQLAHFMKDKGVKEGTPITVWARRDSNYIISIIAILKLGCFYVPLDPDYPIDRLNYIIAETESQIVLGQGPDFKEAAKHFSVDSIEIDSPQVEASSSTDLQKSQDNPLANIYILFTSGSTGKPKGVMVNHRGVNNLVKHFQQQFKPMMGNFRMTQNARLGFDASTTEIWYTLLSGGSLFFTPEEILLQADKLRDWLVDNEIRETLLVTPIAEMLFDQKFPPNSKLKYLHLGGDALKRLPQKDFPAQIVNVYGPTECACITVLDAYPLGYDGPITIGKATINTRLYILDQNQKEVAKGDEGELYVAGDSVGNGYWKLPEQTEKAFIRDSEINHRYGEEVIYRTGDLVREIADGRIEFINRIDFQVKIRGLRIELTEIENVILRISGIKQTIVLALGQGNDKYLVCFYITEENIEIDSLNILERCQKELPEYMVPLFFKEMNAFPLTDNKKVDRSALAQEDFSINERAVIAPKTDSQKEILQVWKQFLKVESISIEDNFFYIGGHSLKAAQVVNQLNKIGYKISLPQFMKHPTIEQQSLIADRIEGKEEINILIPRNRDLYPLSDTQNELLILDKLDSSKKSHNIVVEFELNSGIEFDLAQHIFNNIFQKYEAFSSVFIEDGGKFYQKLLAHKKLSIEVIDVADYQEYHKKIIEIQDIKIDVSNYPLYKLQFIRLGNKKFLIMVIHHIIFDGWSMKVILEEIEKAYKQLDTNTASDSSNLFQNIDYVNSYKLAEDLERSEKEFWKDRFEVLGPNLHLFDCYDRPQLLTYKGKREWFNLDNKTSQKLKDYAKENSVTFGALLLTIYKYVLAELSHSNDIVVGSPFAHRKNSSEEQMIGYYTNMIAIRTRLTDGSFLDNLKQVNRNFIDALGHSDLSFGKVVQSLNLPHDVSRTQLFQAILVLQNWHSDGDNSVIKNQREIGSESSKSDITLNIEEVTSGLECWLEYNPDIYNKEQALEIKDLFCTYADNLPSERSFQNTRTCFIITETSLGILSAEELLRNNYHIYGLISPNAQVQQWAKSKGIYSADLSKKAIISLLEAYKFDYLFSIVNGIILDRKILALPTKMTINYHDSLLPKYAGVYATYWALINDEKEHGISWHKVDQGIDTGNILVQKKVKIDGEDTSNLLNAKCYDAAIEAFKELVNLLDSNQIEGIQQDESQRTYFAIHKRERNNYLLDIESNIDLVERYYRASNFGDNNNEVASLRIKIGFAYYIIKSCSFNKKKTKDIGRLQKDNEKLILNLHDGQVIIDELLKLDGSKSNLNELADSYQIETIREEDFLQYLELVKAESFWLKQVANYQEIELPKSSYNKTDSSSVLNMDNPDLALYISFLARLSTQEIFSLPITVNSQDKLIANVIPASFKIDFDRSINDNIANITKVLKRLKKKQSYLLDLVYRYSDIADRIEKLQTFELFDYEQIFNIFKEALNSNLALKDIDLISDRERKRIKEWNSVELAVDKNKSYIDLFKESVSLHSERFALEYGSSILSYNDLDKESQALANYLYNLVGSGNIIAIYSNRSIDVFVSILAILKSGNAYLPIDPNYPKERIEHILEDSQTKTMFMNRSHSIANIENILYFEEIESYKSDSSKDEITISPESIAYVIYTSGSTGKPKGVKISHANLVNHNLVANSIYGTSNNDRVLQFASVSFDISVEEIFPTWLAGACLVLRDEETNKSASAFYSFVEKNNISIVDLPTAFWHQIAKALPEHTLPQCLKLVIIGGEKASAEIYSHWLQHTSGKVKLFNTYGPTEATIIASTDEGVDDTIGKTIPNTQLWILDRFMNDLPIGIAGDIYIGGNGLSQGYLYNPEMTKEKFFNHSSLGYIYNSGDYGLFRDDGKIKFLGRNDNQIKLNGFRIELSEIESAFAKNLPLKEVVADIKEVAKEVYKIFLYYVANHNITEQEFSTTAQEHLPSYMKPNFFVKLDSIPLTTNGKIDKKRLPVEIPESIVEDKQALNITEINLLPIFQHILKKEITFTDNFFDNGGDSLNAIELIVSIEKSLGIKLNSAQLYQNPTVRELSQEIERDVNFSNEVITVLQKGNKDYSPLFLTHTTPGDVLGYVNLIHNLDKRIPVYGIQSKGLSGECHSSIPEMVACYADKILEMCPQGPYFIGGWCYGGVLAYEISVELKKRGEEIADVYLFETWGRPNSKFKKLRYLTRRIVNAILLGPSFWKEYIQFKLKYVADIHKVLEDDFVENLTSTIGEKSQEELEKLKRIYRSNINALNNYKMSNYDGKINLFLAEERLEGIIPDPRYGWPGIVKDYNKFTVKGSHMTVLKNPWVKDISSVISKRMLNNKE